MANPKGRELACTHRPGRERGRGQSGGGAAEAVWIGDEKYEGPPSGAGGIGEGRQCAAEAQDAGTSSSLSGLGHVYHLPFLIETRLRADAEATMTHALC